MGVRLVMKVNMAYSSHRVTVKNVGSEIDEPSSSTLKRRLMKMKMRTMRMKTCLKVLLLTIIPTTKHSLRAKPQTTADTENWIEGGWSKRI